MQLEDLINTELGGCRVISLVGKGGMGAVFRAEHMALERIVALKVLPHYLATDTVSIGRFLREAKSIARLDHPNIVQIFNVGYEKGMYFIVMQYIDGTNLNDLVKREGRLPFARATRIILGVAKGLGEAHSKGVIHRDIKPANILIATDDTPKLVDFGLARQVEKDRELTLTGEIFGTAYYMSPEQALGKPADHRSDLYSLGATYYYALAGAYLFDGTTATEVMLKHINQKIPPLGISESTQRARYLLERLLSKDPQDRFASAAEVCTELERLLVSQEDKFNQVTTKLVPPKKVKKIPKVKPKARAPSRVARNILCWLLMLLGAILLYYLGRVSGSIPSYDTDPFRKVLRPFYTLDEDFIWRMCLCGLGIAAYTLALVINRREFRSSVSPFCIKLLLLAWMSLAYVAGILGSGFDLASRANCLVLGGITTFASSLLIWNMEKIGYYRRVLPILIVCSLYLFYAFGCPWEKGAWLIYPFANIGPENARYLLLFAFAIISAALAIVISMASGDKVVPLLFMFVGILCVYLFSVLCSQDVNWTEAILSPFKGIGHEFQRGGSILIIGFTLLVVSFILTYKKTTAPKYLY
jgi:serine/threonine protein kinase